MIEEYYEDRRSEGLTPEEQIEDLPKVKENIDLDNDPQTQKYFRMIQNWWNYERRKQGPNRLERIKAHNYKDGDQWEDEDKAVVESRGQQALVFNRIKPCCDWLIGTEKRTRVDYSILPRKKTDSKTAEKKTKLVKYLQDTSKASFSRSSAFSDSIISGVGWIDHGIRSDESEEPLFVEYEDWRNVWHDSHAKKADLSDGRYQFRSKIVDYDIAVEMFPERKNCIKAALNAEEREPEFIESDIDPESDLNDIEEDYHRDRVRLISCEYRIPAKVQIIRGDIGTIDGVTFDPEDEAMDYLVREGYASLYDAVKMEMWKMIFCEGHVLRNRKRIYNHNHFSLIPIWCYRKKKDNSPYGIVKNLIDPQNDLNKRRSKALFILSTKQSMAQEGAIDDHDEFVEERDRPDGHMIVKDINGVKLIEERSLAKEHVMLMEQDSEYIESASGVTDEARGLETNAISGIAMQSREQQAHVNTAEPFDNYRYAFQISGEIQLSLIEQFYTEAKTIRLTGDKGQNEFVEINQQGENGEIEDDITSTKANFIVASESYHATVRQAMFESLGEMLSKLSPEIAIQVLDMWFDLSDLPGKDVMVQRIRAINGQFDPDEDPDDPEVQEREAIEREEQEKKRMIEEKMTELEMALKEAEIQEKEAEAEKDIADAQLKLAKIKNDINLTTIKRAEALNKIEIGEKTV